MASYLDATLSKGETIEYRTKQSLKHCLLHCLFGGLLTWWGWDMAFATPEAHWFGIWVAASGSVFILIALFQYWTTEIAVTNKRVLYKKGFITRQTVEIAFSKIESVEVIQGIFGRILNYGNVHVRGTGANISKIKGVDEPLKFRAAVMRAGDL